MNLNALPWLILFLPLLAAGIITLFTLKDRKASAALSISAILIGFVATILFIAVNGWTSGEVSLNWLSIGNFTVDFGLKLYIISDIFQSDR